MKSINHKVRKVGAKFAKEELTQRKSSERIVGGIRRLLRSARNDLQL